MRVQIKDTAVNGMLPLSTSPSPLSSPPFHPSPRRLQSQTSVMSFSSCFWRWFRGRWSQKWRSFRERRPFVLHFMVYCLWQWPHCAGTSAGCKRSPQSNGSAGVSLLHAVARFPLLRSSLTGSTCTSISLHTWGTSTSPTVQGKSYQRKNVCSRLKVFPMKLHAALLRTSEGTCKCKQVDR